MIIRDQSVKVITPPDITSIVTSGYLDAKAYARISVSSQDETFITCLRAAYNQAERLTRRAILTQTIRCSFQRFCERMKLPRPPLISVTSFQFREWNTGTLTTVNSGLYGIDTESGIAAIYRKDQQVWPTIQAEANPVQVTYQAGYGSFEDIPDDLLQAIYSAALYYYDNRGDASTIEKKLLPKSSDTVFNQYKVRIF